MVGFILKILFNSLTMNSQTVGSAEKQASAFPQAAAASTQSLKKGKDISAGVAVAAMATIQDDDERLLTRIGYKQVDLVALWFGMDCESWVGV